MSKTNKTLNLETFNEIIFDSFKDEYRTPEGLRDLLVTELQAAYSIKIQAMEELVNKLNNGLSYHEQLKVVNNIDSSLDYIGGKLKEIEKEHTELTQE